MIRRLKSCSNTPDFYKPKPPAEEAGSEPLFNEECLDDKGNREPIFVVESPLCALSVEQCGGRAIATCGGSGKNKLVIR